MQMSNAWVLSHLVGREEWQAAEADCGLPLAINKSRYISVLPIPFTLLIRNNYIVRQLTVTDWFLSVFKVASKQ